jgi:hypothetical protein
MKLFEFDQELNKKKLQSNKFNLLSNNIAQQNIPEGNDYFDRRRREEEIISGQKPARKKTPSQTSDYARRREQEKKKATVATENKKPYPKTWHDVDPKLGKQVDKMSQAEKVKKGLAHPDTLKKKGVAEGHADQQRKVFKKNGKPVGEVGIDRESSPGVGQWYMKCYAYDIDYSGYDSYEEAVAELKHCLRQGVAEGFLNESAYEEAWELISQPVPEIQQFVKQLGLAQDDTTAKQIAPMIDATPDTQLPAASIPKLKNLANKGNDVQTLKAIQQISGRPDAAQQYAKIMQARDAGEGRQRGYDVSGLINSVKSGNYEAPVLLKLATGTYVIGGRTRLYAALALGIPAKVKIISVSTFAKQGQQGVAEGSEKTFTVVYYSKKTDRNVSKQIKASSESELWDRLRAKGIDVVSIKEQSVAEGLRDPKDNPCWKGYKPVGTKKKNGRTVPNCVPVKENNQQLNELFDQQQDYYKLSNGQVIRVDYRQQGVTADAVPGSIKITVVDPKVMPTGAVGVALPWDKARPNVKQAIINWAQASK